MTLRGKLRTEFAELDRSEFWKFCVRCFNQAERRSKFASLPFSIDVHYLDKLLVDQGWRCAVSGIRFSEPGKFRKPFGPSLDRIVPALGYVPGNVRMVCDIVNCAMNEWGEEALRQLVAAMKRKRHAN